MDLFHIHHDLIADRTGEAWYRVPSDGPVFRERWDYGSGPSGPYATVQTEHQSQAVHREEPLLTFAWGMDVDPDERSRRFEWAEDNFPDASVNLFWGDFFWAGGLIDRVTLVGVDGHRGVIPFPNIHKAVTTFELVVAHIVHDLGNYPDDYAPVGLIRKLGFAEVRDEQRHGAGNRPH